MTTKYILERKKGIESKYEFFFLNFDLNTC